MSKILIFGDICPVADTQTGFESGNPQEIFSDEILALIAASDMTIGNLECALTDAPTPIKKAGPVLSGATTCAETLRKAGFDALSLANNHIRDCGAQGVESTIETCRAAGIATFGAGATESEAKKHFIAKVGGKSIALVSFAEEEFNAVSPERPGAAILDVYEDFDALKQLKQQVDYMIVLYHGGIEYHPYPSPFLQKKCHKLAASGADLILCQHSHCIGSYEEYEGATIVYGQGNSLFGYRKGNDGWNNGLLIQAQTSDADLKINFFPCTTTADSLLTLPDDSYSESIISEFKNKSAMLEQPDFIKEQWQFFCNKAENLNIPLLLGWNRYLIFLNRKLGGWLLQLVYGQRKRNITHNLIRCDAHQEVIRTILKKYNYE